MWIIRCEEGREGGETHWTTKWILALLNFTNSIWADRESIWPDGEVPSRVICPWCWKRAFHTAVKTLSCVSSALWLSAFLMNQFTNGTNGALSCLHAPKEQSAGVTDRTSQWLCTFSARTWDTRDSITAVTFSCSYRAISSSWHYGTIKTRVQSDLSRRLFAALLGTLWWGGWHLWLLARGARCTRRTGVILPALPSPNNYINDSDQGIFFLPPHTYMEGKVFLDSWRAAVLVLICVCDLQALFMKQICRNSFIFL